MNVKQMIDELSKFHPEQEVIITDGWRCLCYEGKYLIQEFEGAVDIGIGGCDIVEE